MTAESDRPTVDAKRGSRPRSEPGPAPATPPASADTRYVLGTEIARGGMGRVVEATDTVLGRTVALKAALSMDPEAMRRFRRETHITARLEHPSIVPVHDAGTQADGSPFYVMRRVSGRPLDQLVTASTTLAERLALVPHVVAAAQAVGHAHRRGVIHRDIKPSNILVGDLGETVVIDWGLAKVIDEPDDDDPHARPAIDAGASLRTRIGTVFGTPGFMSAEQLRGEPVDARSDVYALGATLYFLLARVPPHSAESEDDMMAAAAAGPPIPIGTRVRGVPPELSTIVDKSLAYDDDVRYPDAAALAEDLQRFLTGQLVASHHYSPRERVMRLVRKHRISFAIAAVAMVGFVIGGSLAIHRIVAERDRANEQTELATTRQHDAESARLREQDRADQLVLVQARITSTTNPTATIATLKQLRSPADRWQRWWRNARDIAAGAQRSGVTWGAAGPRTPASVSISPGGNRALVSGRDGGVRVIELATRTSRTITTCVPDCNAVFASDDQIVTFRDTALDVIDVRDGARHSIVPPNPIRNLVASPGMMLWIDHEDQLWSVATAGGTPSRVVSPPLGRHLNTITKSFDGHWALVAAAAGALLVDLTSGTSRLLAKTEAEGAATWRRDSRAVAVAFDDHVDVLSLDGIVLHSITHTGMMLALAFGKDDLLYAMSLTGLEIARGTTFVAQPSDSSLHGQIGELVPGFNDSVIGGTSQRLWVISPGRMYTLQSPIEGLVRFAAMPDSRYLVGVVAGRILVWTLDDLSPHASTLDSVVQFLFVGTHDVLANQDMAVWTWTDLDTGEHTPIADIPAMVASGIAISANAAVLILGDEERAYLLRKGHPAELIRDHVHNVALDGDLAMLAVGEGGLLLYDTTTKNFSTLIDKGVEVDAIGWAGHWLAATLVDGTLWRQDRRTGAQQHVKLSVPAPASTFRMTDDGAMYVPVGNKIVCWRPDQRIVDHATLPGPIQLLTRAADSLIVETQDGAGYLVDLERPEHIVGQFPPGTRSLATANGSNLIATNGEDGTVTMIDVQSGERWPMMAPFRSPITAFDMTSDGARMGGLINSTLWVWPLSLPETADATAAWLDQMTNATAELGASILTWQPQTAP